MSLLEQHQFYLHRCTICHDQCQFATAELFASGRQALATSRKAMLIEAVQRGDLDWSPEVVEVIYSGLSSGVQHAVCVDFGDPQGWSDETIYLRAARAEIVRAGKAPAWVSELRQAWQQSGNVYGLAEGSQSNPADTVFYFDAADRAFEPRAQAAWLEIARRLEPETRAGMVQLGSSGFELFDLGLLDEARSSAESLFSRLQALGAKRILCSSPEAAYMLARIWPAWGLALPAQLMHTSQWLAEALQNLPPLPITGSPAAFLDPSCLARYLDVTEPPRASLTQLGVPLVELVRSRHEAPPSGSYFGELPGAWMKRAAEDCRSQAHAVGAGELITASPFDTRNLGLGKRFPLLVTPLWRAVLERLEAG